MLELDRLAVNYGPIKAVRDLSLTVEAGEIVTVLGANGAGKSTSLQAIVGLLPVHHGSICFDGQNIAGQSTERIVRRGLTLTPEGRHIFAPLTVEENLKIGAATRSSAEEVSRQWDQMMELFPILASRKNQLAGTLSGGEQQQLAIARSLMSKPRLLLLDEPSLGLAPQVVELIFDLIGRLRDMGLTILLVEQNVHQALDIADRGYVVSGGTVVLQGTAAELKISPDVQKAYLGHA
ncbi:ABC transporter ATP-binding protein [Dongia soli]|uniref:ABC transporter ATP-binding protein n=1 Tax=Dongia soli TaxID=600628 RepID=UPI002A698E01|nr:ABC transporter ATP-binding protein [Dongia soli]